MDKKQIEKIIFETLEKCGIKIPVEQKFDYSCTDMPEKAMEFVRLTGGNWRNSVYVRKFGRRYDDEHYFDLLFVANEKGEPVCLPVPIASKLFNEDIDMRMCKGSLMGGAYEIIYRHYYEEQKSLPF